MNRNHIHAAWQALEAGEAYALINDYHYYVETPEEAMDRDHEERESVLRIFLTEDDGEIYRQQVCDSRNLPKDKTFVLKADLDDIYAMIPTLNQRSEHQHNTTLRVDICTIREDEWPRVVDPIYSRKVDLH